MDREKLRNLLLDSARIKNLESSNKPTSPSVVQMAKNLTRTVIDSAKTVAAGNTVNVEGDVANKRKAICESCTAYNKVQQRCTKCGCFIAVKAYLRAASCPLGKW
jgi:formamidopyrimidine-DNA glycosylase